jgi:NAD(P)H-dependent FMN reductase
MAYKIAIIVGSLREASLNRKVARSICAMRNDNLDCSMIEIGDLPLYNQDPTRTRRSNMCASAADCRRRRRAVRVAGV